LMVISWPTAFDLFIYFLAYKPLTIVQAIIGHFTDLETALSLKDFFNDLGVSRLNYEDSINEFTLISDALTY
jgi:hypothetical protein